MTSKAGLAPIASALAVELLAAMLQHPLGVAAPAASGADSGGDLAAEQLPLGGVPHMIRGRLSGV